MGKALHKPRPSAPKWFFWDNDNCWFCEFSYNQRGCSNCKILKKLAVKQQKKRERKEKKHLFDF